MSTWYAHELLCPRCEHSFTATLAYGIHASRVPHVREQVLRGELHHMSCPGCGTELDVHRQIAYTDFDRHHWVEIARPEQRARWAEIERDALARFDRALTGAAPMIQPLRDQFRVRLVFDLDELRERLAIWDAGVDDALVECIKLQCLRERPELLAPLRRIRVRSLRLDGAIEMASILEGAPRDDLSRWTVPAEVVRATQADLASWRTSVPELFGRGFVSADRYLGG